MNFFNKCEFSTTRIASKLLTNFSNEYFDQYALFKEGDGSNKVTFTVTLVDTDTPGYFYMETVAEKLNRVLLMKTVAGQFFKA